MSGEGFLSNYNNYEKFCQDRTNDNSSWKFVSIIFIVIAIIATILSIIPSMILYYYYIYRKNSSGGSGGGVQVNRFFKILVIIITITFTIAAILNSIGLLGCTFYNGKFIFYCFIIIYWIFNFIGCYGLYILYASRLYFTFRETSHALSVWQIRLLVVPIVTFGICLIISPILQSQSRTAFTIVVLITTIVTALAFFILSWLFVRRLSILATERACTIIIPQKPSNEKNVENISKNSTVVTTPPTSMEPIPIVLNEQQIQLVEIMTKYCILAAVTLIVSIAMTLICTTFFYFIPIMGLLLTSLFNISICVALWCVYLQHSFANPTYHICCRSCESIVKRKLSKKVGSMSNSRKGTVQEMIAEMAADKNASKL